ncbi:hypothetical protein [Coleofasciculus sp. FACHB-1120]|nr:hypothetical protein [Coleofasciculus sp. FACHB-1120]
MRSQPNKAATHLSHRLPFGDDADFVYIASRGGIFPPLLGFGIK